jgi:peptidoglycan-associated lipoprotein
MTSKLRILLIAAVVCSGAIGCGDEPKANTADDNSTVKTSAPKGDKADESKSAVKIDDKIIKACGDLPTAKFAFDSSEVSPEATNVLDALARCFITGPLKGKGMKLIGHADPRGELEYNLGLGQRRAGSISGFLAKKGVEQGKMATSSKGEFEASGTDEDSWAKDRRVEILLAE